MTITKQLQAISEHAAARGTERMRDLGLLLNATDEIVYDHEEYCIEEPWRYGEVPDWCENGRADACGLYWICTSRRSKFYAPMSVFWGDGELWLGVAPHSHTYFGPAPNPYTLGSVVSNEQEDARAISNECGRYGYNTLGRIPKDTRNWEIDDADQEIQRYVWQYRAAYETLRAFGLALEHGAALWR